MLVWRTRFGYELRGTGMNAEAARMSGINPKKMDTRVPKFVSKILKKFPPPAVQE